MTTAFRYCAAALVAAAAAAIAPAAAQFPTFPETDPAPPETTAPKPKKAPPAGPNVAGVWAGEVSQVGGTAPYKFEIAITPRVLETKYPDLNCTGKLTRVGQSRSYVFFIEVISQGSFEKGGRCPDGTITVARAGDNLALGWFGNIKGDNIVAYGMLKKK
ncbi:MAG: hypothetical protein QOI12_5012 [Alphaproteobacteria bacterium]|jgi:hypothetical protein|nr:hypothetical protein [Alphaproteobacteria bacterium]